MADIIRRQRSIIPACDAGPDVFSRILKETCDVPGVGGYKIGAALALSMGLPAAVELARTHTDKPLIYDHQKACTDIPDTGEHFAEVVKNSGIDALILFPLSGPQTQIAWIRAAHTIGLPVITGGYMTHDQFLDSEHGYISRTAVDRMFTISAENNVQHFVVPGNKPNVVAHLRELLQSIGVSPTFYAPGFISQGGSLSEAAKVAGPKWHAIVGRAIIEAPDMQKAAADLAARL